MNKDEFQLIQTSQEAIKILKDLSQARPKRVAIDTETTGLDWQDLVIGFSLAWRQNDDLRSCYVPVAHPPGLFSGNCPVEVADRLLVEVLENYVVLFHNSTFDILRLKRSFGREPRMAFFDTKVAARLYGLEAGWDIEGRPSTGLVELWSHHLGKGTSQEAKTMRVGKRVMVADAAIASKPSDMAAAYAEGDARMTYELAEIFWPKISSDSTNQILWANELRFLALVRRIIEHGILLNQDFAEDKIKEFEKKQGMLLAELVGFGWRKPEPMSSLKVGKYLFDTLGLTPLGFTSKGKPSTKAEDLEIMAAKGAKPVQMILDYRQYEKALGSWLWPFLEAARTSGDGRIHPDLDPEGTVSGRMACRRPNLQAVPMSDRGLIYGSMKGLFTAPKGAALINLDYKQADLRLATCYAMEKEMARAFATTDPYTELARLIYDRDEIAPRERFLAKQTTLATINGIGAETLAETLDVTYPEASKLLNLFRKRFPGFASAARKTEHQYHNLGYVKLWTGRKLYLGKYEDKEKSWSRLVQGGVAEMVKQAMIWIDEGLYRDLNLKSRMVLQIHDSIILEVYRDEAPYIEIAKTLMEDALPVALRQRADPPMRMEVEAGRWS